MDGLHDIENKEIGFAKQQLPTELERVQTFQSVLESLVSVHPVDATMDLRQPNPAVDKARQLLTYERTTETTLNISPSFQVECPVSEVRFEPLESRAGKNSRHGVFFGNLIVGEEYYSIPVAVKPFIDTSHSEATTVEYLNTAAAHSLGLSSIMPVGFILDGERQSYLLTRLEESLTTLDTIDWSEFYPNTANNPGMSEHWSQTARLLALFHSLGSCCHGDTAGRNLAITADDSGVIMIDWELARISLQPPRDAEIRYGYSQEDLNVLVESLCRPAHINYKAGLGIFYGKGGDWWQAFDNLFFKEYASHRLDFASIGKHKRALLADVKEELPILERNLKDSMEMQRDICSQIQPPLDTGIGTRLL